MDLIQDKQSDQNERQKQLATVLHRSIDLLARREHSAKELQSKLIQKGFNSDLIDQTIERLQRENLQSDERFTEAFVNERMRRGHGPVKIQHQLNQKGISSELVESYIDANGAEWLQLAQLQYQKKYTNPHVNNYNEWTKRARFLQGRGFTSAQIRSVVFLTDENLD